ncbi:MAG: NAD(P)H-dependent oxidoreductase subunit E [Pirellulales bacterium]|nr:NAD(P)H-dependent oxidoreductase subunit E [Pirellulales bacterium]
MSSSHRILTDEIIAEIKAYFPHYPTKQAVTLPALHVVNRYLRWVPPEAVVEIAQLLELAPAQVQDTMTFYRFFKQHEPHGLTRMSVCRSLSCALRGGDQILEHLCQKAGIRPGETTPDGTLTIEAAECLGACDFAPCIMVNDQLHKEMTTEKVEKMMEGL